MAIFEWLMAAWMTFTLMFLLAIGKVLAEIRNHLNRSATQRALGRAALPVFDGQGLS
jgi:hypothetical protein